MKRITDPQSGGVDCKSTPAAQNKIGLYPEELGASNDVYQSAKPQEPLIFQSKGWREYNKNGY